MRTTEPQPFSRSRGLDAKGSLVIDGEAIVVGRRASERMPEPGRRSCDRVLPDGDAASARPDGTFGRRPRAMKAMPRDLVFQGTAASFGAHPATGASDALRARRLSIFAAPMSRSRLVRRAAGLALGAGLLAALPVLAVHALTGPLSASADEGGTGPLILAELSHRIEPHGGGAVLTVEGLILNRSAEPAEVPRLRIALAGPDGGTSAKSFTASVRRLSSGASLRFHSAVAVADGTRGDVEVGFVSEPRPGTDVR